MEEGGREGGEGERGKGGGQGKWRQGAEQSGAERNVVHVYSVASATSLGAGNTGHTPDPPQQDRTVQQNVLGWMWKDVVVEGGVESGVKAHKGMLSHWGAAGGAKAWRLS